MVFYPSSESKQIAPQRYSHALWFKDLNKRHFNPVLKISELLSRLITVYQFNLNLNRLSYSYYVNQWSGTPVEKKSSVTGDVDLPLLVSASSSSLSSASPPLQSHVKEEAKFMTQCFAFCEWGKLRYTHSREAHFNSSSRCFRSVFNEVKRFCDNA